ncbi:MFS transporter [Acutalibacter caecimuris]|uniref:MFS transporter n=1 Tax=Acutalibacter caecimuris TaxID=3093657 RepID=UPI002AC93352|nr:MFS transporter [Acutalibacter sp. M00118]
MSTQKFKSYSVYLLFRFCFSLFFSMATVLSIVYHLEVVKLNAFHLVLVGTVLETACFLFEIPTGVVADLYSRRRSVLIGVFLYSIGFLTEGALPWFGTVLLAQVVWGCGDTFITGALEAWIASEETGKPMDKVFMRGSQLGQFGGIAGVVMGTLLGNLNLQLPIVLAGISCLLFGLVLLRIMPETNFSPAPDGRQGLLRDFANLFKLNLSFVKGAPVLLALLAITLCGGLASEGFDRLSTAHFLEGTVMPDVGPLNSVTWFGVISLAGSGLGILASQLLINRMEKKGTIRRTSLVMFASAGYILCLVLFATSRSFWLMLIVFLLAGLMRTIKEPVLAAWMNDHVEERMRATVFSTNGQLDSFGQIIGGPIVGLIAKQISVSWGLVCTAFLLLPALILVPVAAKAGKKNV